MAGETSQGANSAHIIRSEVWSSQLKEIFQEELIEPSKYVTWLTDFPDGTTFTIPTVGAASVSNYVEDTAIVYTALDKGEFQFTINKYIHSATYITKKQRQDSYVSAVLEAGFIPKQARAIAEFLEANVFALQSGQTLSDPNDVNGANHRFVASGTNEVITVSDFAYADFALTQANAPQGQRIAIVHPSVEFELSTLTNLVNVSNNPRWEGIIADKLGTGLKFVKNVYGFDTFVSKFLATGITETITGAAGAKTAGAGAANLFFSAESDALPFIGAWRQMPEVDSQYNQNFQREEYVTTARFGTALYRPENLVVVISDTDQVSPG